jgi:hypothetical protein
VVFGGQTYPSACKLANEMFLPDLNTRQVKKAYWHTIHVYREEMRTTHSKNTGQGRSQSATVSLGEGSADSHAEGKSTGQGSSSGLSHGSSLGSGMAIGAPVIIPDQPEDGVEGWFTQSESAANFNGENSSRSSTSSETLSDSHSQSEFSSEAETTGQSVFESEGETTSSVWVPIPIKELGSESEWSREEKLSKIAEMLKHQPQRHAFIKLDLEKTQPLLVPTIRDHFVSDENLSEYERRVFTAQGAIPGPEVDRLIAENGQRFLERAREYLSDGKGRKKNMENIDEDEEFFEN